MIKPFLTKGGVAAGGLALALTAGAGSAAADPDLGPAVNSTCSYEQFEAALNAQDANAAAAFQASPAMQSGLRQFLAAPPDQRRHMAQQLASHPANKPYIGLLQQVFNTCNSY